MVVGCEDAVRLREMAGCQPPDDDMTALHIGEL